MRNKTDKIGRDRSMYNDLHNWSPTKIFEPSFILKISCEKSTRWANYASHNNDTKLPNYLCMYNQFLRIYDTY